MLNLQYDGKIAERSIPRNNALLSICYRLAGEFQLLLLFTFRLIMNFLWLNWYR